MTDKEIWADITGYEGLYQVSNLGRIKSLERHARNGTGLRRVRERILRPAYLNKQKPESSYLVVNLLNKDKHEVFLIHRLVLHAFVGSCPEGMEACHNDGKPTNNRLENLRWDTIQANRDDCIRHGTRTRIQGENHYNCKRTEAEVKEIRRLFASGKYNQQELAGMFNINFVQIHKIVKRRIWKHI